MSLSLAFTGILDNLGNDLVKMRDEMLDVCDRIHAVLAPTYNDGDDDYKFEMVRQTFIEKIPLRRFVAASVITWVVKVL